jgi:hypothetical protein
MSSKLFLMKQSLYFYCAFLLLPLSTMAQSEQVLPYYEIPKEAENFSAGTVASRMVDGLGFRYRWATDSLRKADLDFKPGENTRTTLETLAHIYELSIIIVNSTTSTVNEFPDTKAMTFVEMRAKTLENFYRASQKLRAAKDTDLKGLKSIFKRQNGTRELPFWNIINGPIADALWHVGQVVSFRRSSGNPFTDRVNVFTGTVNK